MASRATRGRWRPTIRPFRGRTVDRSCITLKVSFDTRDEAITAADRSMSEGRVKPGCHLTPYVCGECHRFHIGNQRIYFPKD